MAAIVVKSRFGAEMYARHPMATQRIVVGALWTGRAVVFASKVRSEWLGKAAERSSGGSVILSVCGLPLCMSFTLLHKLS
jgi:hypothetical protein